MAGAPAPFGLMAASAASHGRTGLAHGKQAPPLLLIPPESGPLHLSIWCIQLHLAFSPATYNIQVHRCMMVENRIGS